MPCGAKAAFATRGYFAGQYHRRGRQVGRVLATQYMEVVADRLFAGNIQLIKVRPPLVEAAEVTLHLDETKRTRTMIRVDAGAGTLNDLNWLLSQGYEIMAKEYVGKRVLRLAETVTAWVQGPDWSERSFSWVSYRAPEQYDIDVQTDIYGLGTVFNTLITGIVPTNALPVWHTWTRSKL